MTLDFDQYFADFIIRKTILLDLTVFTKMNIIIIIIIAN